MLVENKKELKGESSTGEQMNAKFTTGLLDV